MIKLSEEKKIGIVWLWKWNEEYYALTPEKNAEVWKGHYEIDRKWENKVKMVSGYKAHGMGKFSSFAFYEVTDIGNWVAYAEEISRYWNKYVEYEEIYTGIRV